MKLIVGLGNPGKKYEHNRHNVGFMALDLLASKLNAAGWSSRAAGLIAPFDLAGEKGLLVKPQTFMNLSGRCVGELFHFHKCKPEDLVVIHDELDLLPLELKLKKGGGAGGHNGLKSIDESLGSENNGYYRIRVGIGHPRAIHPNFDVADYVLQDFNKHEQQSLESILDQVSQAAILLAQGDATKAMNQFNRKTKAAE